jgi:hypothetical protein
MACTDGHGKERALVRRQQHTGKAAAHDPSPLFVLVMVAQMIGKYYGVKNA